MHANRVAVIGGGIIGVAVARELTRVLPASSVTLMEKESGLGSHQTGHNSGVVHAGIYYQPDSLKASLCRRGARLISEYARDNDLPFDRCGKVVIARSDDELPALHAIFDRAIANGVSDVRLVSRDELRHIEPHADGLGAVHSPSTAVVDYLAVTRMLGKDLQRAGGEIRLNSEVIHVSPIGNQVLVATRDRGESYDLVIACAGLQSDRLTKPDATDPRVIPFYGDYMTLLPEKEHLANGLIYPVPDPRYPFLGVHVSKRHDGAVTLGPNAFLSLARERYGRWNVDIRDVAATLGFGGFWRFAGKNATAAIRETRTAVNRRAFVGEARRLIPELRLEDVVYGGRGIRAQAMDRRGSLIDDFVISRRGRLVQVRNAPSPGATASMAIAEHIVKTSVESVGIATRP